MDRKPKLKLRQRKQSIYQFMKKSRKQSIAMSLSKEQ